MKRIRKRKCRHCHVFFLPDYRNVERQKFCSKPECRHASKMASNKAWRAKNPNYFKRNKGDNTHVLRVQQWRLDNPGYRHRKKACAVLQDDIQATSAQKQDNGKQNPVASLPPPPVSPFPWAVLQDLSSSQLPVITLLIGLIAHMAGLGLQDDLEAAITRLAQLGHDILRGSTKPQGGHYDLQVPHLSRPHPPHTRAIQLGGSPSGP